MNGVTHDIINVFEGPTLDVNENVSNKNSCCSKFDVRFDAVCSYNGTCRRVIGCLAGFNTGLQQYLS